MVLYPEVMKRAQAALDTVVERDRVPVFSDLEKVPYIAALMKEVLRWRSVAPIGTFSSAYPTYRALIWTLVRGSAAVYAGNARTTYHSHNF